MKAIKSKYRSMLIDSEECPLWRDHCIRGDATDKCKYYDHMTEIRDNNGWAGFTMYCRYDKPQQPRQLELQFI